MRARLSTSGPSTDSGESFTKGEDLPRSFRSIQFINVEQLTSASRASSCSRVEASSASLWATSSSRRASACRISS